MILNYTSGREWVTCTGDQGKDLMKEAKSLHLKCKGKEREKRKEKGDILLSLHGCFVTGRRDLEK